MNLTSHYDGKVEVWRFLVGGCYPPWVGPSRPSFIFLNPASGGNWVRESETEWENDPVQTQKVCNWPPVQRTTW